MVKVISGKTNHLELLYMNANSGIREWAKCELKQNLLIYFDGTQFGSFAN